MTRMMCYTHKVYFMGRLKERKGDVYAFRCETCNKVFWIKVREFWNGS